MTFHIEIMNVHIPKLQTIKEEICRYDYIVFVFLIPGLEVPFRGLNLNHNFDEIPKGKHENN